MNPLRIVDENFLILKKNNVFFEKKKINIKDFVSPIINTTDTNEIRNLLATRFDREMLMVLLQVDRVDLDEIVSRCNYSKGFIETANDLQILDAISECYEEFKLLNRSRN